MFICSMFIRAILTMTAAVAFAALAQAAPKAAADKAPPQQCTLDNVSLDGVQAAIDAAPTCDKAQEVFGPCALGSSGDVQLGEAVIKKCEADFAGKLTARQKHNYDQEMKRCWQKYRRESGTLYRSMEAMCAAGVAQTYSHRYSKAAPVKSAPAKK